MRKVDAQTMNMKLPVTRPLLYTDTIGGEQVLRDDMWALTTEELNAIDAEIIQYKTAAEEDLIRIGELRSQLYDATLELAALRADLAAAIAAKEEAEREPRSRPDVCQHRKARMIEWINEGACPVCLTASSGMNKERAEEAENALKNIFGTLLPVTNTADSTTTGMARKCVAMLKEAEADIIQYKTAAEEDLIRIGELRSQLYDATLELAARRAALRALPPPLQRGEERRREE
jgi:hypothetical protein